MSLATLIGDAAEELVWQEEALCAETDPEAFFPEKGHSVRAAKQMCGLCNVKTQCLMYALDNDERFGIWGGMSERERRVLRRQRQAQQVDLYIGESHTVDLDADDSPLTDAELAADALEEVA